MENKLYALEKFLCIKCLSCNLEVLMFLDLFENGKSILEDIVNDYCLIPCISIQIDIGKHPRVLV